MENIKEKLPMIIAVLIAIAILVLGYYFLFEHKDIYFTKIDNTKVEQISASDDMKYEYTLKAYTKNGKEKELKFKTSRELRQDAYLQLDVMIMRGVVDWKEVQYNQLPQKVQENY